MLAAPIIIEHEDIFVVRDDLLPGGTKRRAIHVFFDDHDEYVYASPVWGYAQVALAHAAIDYAKYATIVCAQHRERKPLTVQAQQLGANIIEVNPGYLTVTQARAREYAQAHHAKLLPFGLDDPAFINEFARIARELPITPTEVWTITSSGVLSRALQLAWPDARFFGVQVGATPDAGRATVMKAAETFERPARVRPPFPSCLQYDAKAWTFIKQHASKGALFWNVGA